jgi:cardiolipin synthase
VIGWVGIAWLAPLIGPLLYVGFGINRIQRRAIALRFRPGVAWEPTERLSDRERIRHEEVEAIYPQLVGLARLGRQLNGRRLLSGNAVRTLLNGDEAFPAMLAAIDRAERSISLLSYIFDADPVGHMFEDALIRAQMRGVEVRVLVDHVGARYSRPNMVKVLQRAGISAQAFLPTLLPRSVKYANLRNHRKILVVDGRHGFTGGTNIREGHWLARQTDAPVQCVHFSLEGPIVAQLQEMFAIDWAFTTGETLEGRCWFPEIPSVGDVWARGVPDGPDEDFEKITHTLMGAISSAAREIRIVTPYFLPQPALIQTLAVTALRGVAVHIVLPSQSNLPFVQWASTALFWQLLEKGCHIHLSAPPFDHSKLMVVDRMWSLIGSSNWDPRSLRLNFEFNVECYDPALASELTVLIDQKMADSRELRLEDVNSRSFPIQLRDGLSRLLTPYL